MSKLSEYPILPISIRLTETGQELTFKANPKGDKLHVAGTVGAETYEGFIVVEPIQTAHPDMRWDVRLSLSIPDAVVAAPKTKAVARKTADPVVDPVVNVDVDGQPTTEEVIEFTDNEQFLMKDIKTDPIEQAREILDAMPAPLKAPLPGEEDALEKLAWEIRAAEIEETQEEAIPQEEYIESTVPPSVGEEEEREAKIVAKATARGRRPKQA